MPINPRLDATAYTEPELEFRFAEIAEANFTGCKDANHAHPQAPFGLSHLQSRKAPPLPLPMTALVWCVGSRAHTNLGADCALL